MTSNKHPLTNEWAVIRRKIVLWAEPYANRFFLRCHVQFFNRQPIPHYFSFCCIFDHKWHFISIFLHSHNVSICVCVCCLCACMCCEVDWWMMTWLSCKSCHAFSYLSAWKTMHASKCSLFTHTHTDLHMYRNSRAEAHQHKCTVLCLLCHAGWCVSAVLAPTGRQEFSIRQETGPRAGDNR